MSITLTKERKCMPTDKFCFQMDCMTERGHKTVRRCDENRNNKDKKSCEQVPLPPGFSSCKAFCCSEDLCNNVPNYLLSSLGIRSAIFSPLLIGIFSAFAFWF
ncbi:hypothetical protein niasHT_017257 [Heterodera trifolii]|uniref:Uncharacterized protein n=1 Tax=Heterodera trifolii TaxID=157864 RepID=A0ABD2LGP6_9BILA